MKNKEKFEKLMQNEEFIAKLLEIQTPQEMQSEFKSNGIEISLDEVNEIIHELDSIVNVVADEDLSDVSGGDLTTQEKKDKFIGKFYEKLGDAAGNLVWVIPTVVLSTIASGVVSFHLNRKLKAAYPEPKTGDSNS